jgi:hypothetical protein
MNATGKLKDISGDFFALEATVYTDGNRGVLKCRAFFMSYEIDLNECLASCSVSESKKTSAPGLILKMGLGGLAGHTWMKGYGGTAGALASAASAVNTRKNVVYVTLNFIDGKFIEARTDGYTASVLRNISPQLSSRDIQNLTLQQQRLQRYLDDAPRTYYEVTAEVTALEEEIAELETIKDKASSFDTRENAREKLEQLKNQLDEKTALQNELSLRARAIKKYGDWEKFDRETTEIFSKLLKLEDKVKFRPIKFALLLLSLCGFVYGVIHVNNDNAAVIGGISSLYLLFYLPFFLLYLSLLKSRKKKLNKLQAQYDEYNLEGVPL